MPPHSCALLIWAWFNTWSSPPGAGPSVRGSDLSLVMPARHGPGSDPLGTGAGMDSAGPGPASETLTTSRSGVLSGRVPEWPRDRHEFDPLRTQWPTGQH